MKSVSIFSFLIVIAALHLLALSMVAGLRHLGYILAALLSAALIWSAVFFLCGRRPHTGLIAGVVVGLAVQQVAYSAWRTELPGFWWSLAQFGALHTLVGFGIGKNKL
jgi:hypothetical protein